MSCGVFQLRFWREPTCHAVFSAQQASMRFARDMDASYACVSHDSQNGLVMKNEILQRGGRHSREVVASRREKALIQFEHAPTTFRLRTSSSKFVLLTCSNCGRMVVATKTVEVILNTPLLCNNRYEGQPAMQNEEICSTRILNCVRGQFHPL